MDKTQYDEDGRPSTCLTTAAVQAVSHDNDVALGTHSLNKSHLRPGYLHPSLVRSRSPDTLSIISADEFSELRLARIRSRDVENATVSEKADDTSKPWPRRFKNSLKGSWVRNKGLALVLVADVFATLMGVTTRLLETGSDEEEGMSPFQILFARMSITVICAMIYMWYTRVEHFPLGAPGIRLILVARGVGGFFGVFGMYWSLQYLPIADATVLSFLGPPLACYICSKLLKEPFTRTEQIAASVSLAGVILIARPTAFFSPTGEDKTTEGVVESASASTRNTSNIQIRTVDSSMQEASPHQRLAAVGMGMVGVLGAATAYTTIRWIGQRAHPLISVNYFASWTTLVSAIALAFVPSVPFVLPHTLRQWLLLLYIGVSGFVMQYLLTAGLAYEKSSRANNMVYSQMIFALAADALIWKHFPSALSVGGSSLILGSAVVVAIQKQKIEVVDAIDAGRAEEPREEEEEERQGLMQNATDMEEGRVSPTDAVEMQDQPRHQQSTRAEGPARNE